MPRADGVSVKKRRSKPVRAAITKLLYKAGSSPSEVAELEKVSRPHVTRVMKRQSTSARIRKRIESILEKPWDKLVEEAERIQKVPHTARKSKTIVSSGRGLENSEALQA
jgi:hypothetical protein